MSSIRILRTLFCTLTFTFTDMYLQVAATRTATNGIEFLGSIAFPPTHFQLFLFVCKCPQSPSCVNIDISSVRFKSYTFVFVPHSWPCRETFAEVQTSEMLSARLPVVENESREGFFSIYPVNVFQNNISYVILRLKVHTTRMLLFCDEKKQ